MKSPEISQGLPMRSGYRSGWRQLAVATALIVTGLVPCAQAQGQWSVCFREAFPEEALSALSIKAE